MSLGFDWDESPSQEICDSDCLGANRCQGRVYCSICGSEICGCDADEEGRCGDCAAEADEEE